MPAAAYHPTYRLNCLVPGKILSSLLVGRRRDFSADARDLIKGIIPPPILINQNNIPGEGPYLVTLNHYSRPGFMVFWAALVISAALPQIPIWLMTSAWTDRTRGLDQLRTWLTGKLFDRLAFLYGFVTTPPMPPAPEDASERAMSIRKLDHRLHEQSAPILCLAPEGMDFPDGIPGFPPEGTGKFISYLLKDLKRILPVGVFEEDGKLSVNFGPVYEPENQPGPAKNDTEIILLVMKKIAALLPARMRGQFEEGRNKNR
jgi:hypothetical protein